MEGAPACLGYKRRTRKGKMDSTGPLAGEKTPGNLASSEDGAEASDSDHSMTELYPPELVTRRDLGGTEHGGSTDDCLTEEVRGEGVQERRALGPEKRWKPTRSRSSSTGRSNWAHQRSSKVITINLIASALLNRLIEGCWKRQKNFSTIKIFGFS